MEKTRQWKAALKLVDHVVTTNFPTKGLCSKVKLKFSFATSERGHFFPRFSQVRFVDGGELHASGLPVSPEEFQELVRKQCLRTREFLKKT